MNTVFAMIDDDKIVAKIWKRLSGSDQYLLIETLERKPYEQWTQFRREVAETCAVHSDDYSILYEIKLPKDHTR